MSIAHARTNAPVGEIITIEGMQTLRADLDINVTNYLAEIENIIAEARDQGYACICVDGIHLYTAFYNASGLTEEYFAAQRERGKTICEDTDYSPRMAS